MYKNLFESGYFWNQEFAQAYTLIQKMYQADDAKREEILDYAANLVSTEKPKVVQDCLESMQKILFGELDKVDKEIGDVIARVNMIISDRNEGKKDDELAIRIMLEGLYQKKEEFADDDDKDTKEICSYAVKLNDLYRRKALTETIGNQIVMRLGQETLPHYTSTLK